MGGARQEAESQQCDEEITAADWLLSAVLMRERVTIVGRALCVVLVGMDFHWIFLHGIIAFGI